MSGVGDQDGASAPTLHPHISRSYNRYIQHPIVGGAVFESMDTVKLRDGDEAFTRPVIRRLMAEVHIIELSVVPALAHQGMMIALLDDISAIKYDDAVRVSNGGESMRDEYGCAVLQDQVKSFLDLRLGKWINTGGRFIQDDDGRILQQHAC